MPEFVRLSVSHCQYRIFAGDGADEMGIYTIGDDLLHVGGPHRCTGFTGLHTGSIQMRVIGHSSEPSMLPRGDWDAAAETTLWCPTGSVTVIGLMGGSHDELREVPMPGNGLLRLRVYARHRLDESVRIEDDSPEQHELHLWPVTEETGFRTLYTDDLRSGWPRMTADGLRFGGPQKTASAAEWAMLSLLPRPKPSRLPFPSPRERVTVPPVDPGPRVTVIRSRVMPAHRATAAPDWLAPTIPAGDVEIRLAVADGGSEAPVLTWRWATAASPISPPPVTALPDEQVTTVRMLIRAGIGDAEVTVRHEGVPASQSVALGLIWDHLLDALATAPGGIWQNPLQDRAVWQSALHDRAVEEWQLADKRRRQKAEWEARGWAGTPPHLR
ncbi:hypothetical protein [Actinoplanes couchii]|uniref:Uncharacterized protein n=1 Tax=Actinoplanes couchii TaxID=403638 RepID=A0ABQ3XPU5_9ACTN|nr:hypothetical protein [Actinoplanes couchii]MDR6319173.1 hypothetical protein [Actinoplanes couchii]GID60514.1 hypothetical protein Aco03nite_089180 [Actinoplanes couchii]